MSLLLDNEPLSGSDRESLKKHLQHCKTCHEKYNKLLRLDGSIRKTLITKQQRHLTTDELIKFSDGQTDDASQVFRIERHIQDCETCQELLKDLKFLDSLQPEFKSDIEASPLKKSLKQLVDKIRAFFEQFVSTGRLENRRRWSMVLVITAVVIIFCLIFYKNTFKKYPVPELPPIADQQKTPVEPPTPVLPQADHQPVPRQNPRELYAANFEPAPYLEGLITYNVRAFSINVLAPKPGAKLEEPYFFEWEKGKPAPRFLKILNNRGEEIFSSTPESNRFTYQRQLEPGLYYWKLESEDDLLYLGKFLVE